jgi:hypothetical protein
MKQTTLSVTLEVEPANLDSLSDLIDALKKQEESEPYGLPEKYDRLKKAVPAAHFMSISVFPDGHYDPVFVIEANFDGEPGVFWGQLEAALGDQLRPMLRCCKRPRDDDGPLFDSVAALDSRAPIAPYLEARTQQPSVFHHGNRGLARDRIIAEGELFAATRKKLAEGEGPSPYRGITSQALHAKLRAALLPDFPWLDEPAPARISAGERFADIARLLVFGWLVLVTLSLPGLILAQMMPTDRFFILLGILAVLFGGPLLKMQGAQPGTAAPREAGGVAWLPLLFHLAVAILVYLVVTTTVVVLIAMLLKGDTFREAWWLSARDVALGLVSVVVAGVGIAAGLRRLERRDSPQDKPASNENLIREMAAREDWIPQNHMGSIVLVKPGVLRMILVRAGHRGLGLVLRVVATDGYLGSMRTVHFAHWAFINNSSRLMFFSNFDHSWESYLDDFIEKAHAGLTLAWGSSVGFPPTRFLVGDGASHGRKFKNWARHSMAVSRFWYSAYRDFTVDQIERQNRIANGLRRRKLSVKDADKWALDL